MKHGISKAVGYEMFGSSMRTWQLGMIFLACGFVVTALSSVPTIQRIPSSFKEVFLLIGTFLLFIIFFNKKMFVETDSIFLKSLLSRRFFYFQSIEYVEFYDRAQSSRFWSKICTIRIKEKGRPSSTLQFLGGLDDMQRCIAQLKNTGVLLKIK
jgi:hypothetical protein